MYPATPRGVLLVELATALNASTDELVFEEEERGPTRSCASNSRSPSRFEFEAKKRVKEVLDGLILKHEAKRWASSG